MSSESIYNVVCETRCMRGNVVCGDTDNGGFNINIPLAVSPQPIIYTQRRANKNTDPVLQNRCNLFIIGEIKKSHRNSLPAAASPACIWVMKVEAFAIKPVRKIKFGAGKVEEGFHVEGKTHPFIFKKLVAFFYFVIEI